MFGEQMCWRARTMRVRRGGTRDFQPLQNFGCTLLVIFCSTCIERRGCEINGCIVYVTRGKEFRLDTEGTKGEEGGDVGFIGNPSSTLLVPATTCPGRGRIVPPWAFQPS